jgi:hypothetical protein
MVGLGRLGVWLGWLAGTAAGFPCSPGNLAVYRLELRTFWSEERFPKQYPQWRPPPQWSKTIGETIYILFKACFFRRSVSPKFRKLNR